MGANSVTGKGVGSVEKFGGGKGPGNLRTNFVPMQTPHVVAAGVATIASTTVTVTLPDPLPEAAAKYAIFCTGYAANTKDAWAGTITDDSDTSGLVSFVITATGAGDVAWQIVKRGWGLEVKRNPGT